MAQRASTPAGADPDGVSVSPWSPVSREEAVCLGADLAGDADRVLKVTGSICPDCAAEGQYEDLVVPMVVYEEDDEILLAKECSEHGVIRDVYWRDAGMYHRARTWRDDVDRLDSAHVHPDEPVQCPLDCGLCPVHKSHTGLGNITVTNRCDLSCWYCFFYAREDDSLYEPTKDQIREMVEAMADEEPIGCNAVQITGGEPTIRGDLKEIVELVNVRVDHVQLNTHSGLIAGETERAKALDEAGLDTVYTSFDGVSPDTNPKNYWETPEAIRTYRETDLAVVLVPTIIGGHNDHELGDIIRFAAANDNTIRGVDFQPVSLVGRMPASERHAKRVTIPDAIQAIEEQTDGQVPADAWYPIPSVLPVSEFSELWQDNSLYELSNHFACGMATYVYVDGDELVPITDFFDVEAFLRALEELADRFDAPLSKLGRARVGALLAWELFHGLDRSAQPDDVRLGRWLFEAITEGTYEGLVEFHENALFLGMMHFMDPYNYDLDRVEQCDIHYAMPDGTVVPFCAHNVLPGLYRDAVQAKYSTPVEEWLQRDYASLDDDETPGLTRLRSETVTARQEDQELLRKGPGVYGFDLKRRRDLDDSARTAIHETYERAIEDLQPV